MSKKLPDLKENEYYIMVHQSVEQMDGIYEVNTSDITKSKETILEKAEELFNALLEEYELTDMFSFDSDFNVELDCNEKEIKNNRMDAEYYVYKTNTYFEVNWPDKGWLDTLEIDIIKVI